MTYSYSAPERLEDDWRSGRRTPPEEMLAELRDDIENLASAVGERELVPVQGRVSDYKSWLAAASAMELSGDGVRVTLFSPQRANRRSAVEKLRLFGAELLEHPGRLDLCIWDFWRENVGHVDKSTCESIGCPYYLSNEEDIAERTADALSSHVMETGGEVRLDARAMRRLGSEERQDMCPAQLYLAVRGTERAAEAVSTATYAKAFEDAAMHEEGALDSDVLMLDEAHTVAAEPDIIASDVAPASLADSLSEITAFLEGTPERWANRAAEDLQDLRQSLQHWFERSSEGHVDPADVFAGQAVTLADSFDALERVEGRVLQAMRRAAREGDQSRVSAAASPFRCVQEVKAFLSRVRSYRAGTVDFVHSLYEEGGELVNDMAFRSVTDEPVTASGVSPGDVFEEWQRRGTHPAIADRWGDLLDRYIEALWEGRALRSHEGEPGVPMMPVERLRDMTGAETVVTLSATHNELSDPTRPPERMRPTRHELVCAPVYLRANGDRRRDYNGSDSVSPDTPWFRDMVEEAQRRTGEDLAAVPINFNNREKWSGMPITSVEVDDGEGGTRTVEGVVPHSRGSIGEKGLEELDVDTVMCGVQVQAPAPTARRLVSWWELLAPRVDTAAGALEISWRLLAQHAVSGTIQAGGRFDWGATNLVFERPGLFELAGFEVSVAAPDTPGFAGELCRLYEETVESWEAERAAARAARVVDYLEGAPGKAPSIKQTVGEYRRAHDATDREAREAIYHAARQERIRPAPGGNGVRFETT